MGDPNPAPYFRGLVIVLIVMTLISLFYFQGAAHPKEMSYSAFTAAVERGEIRTVTIQGQKIIALQSGGGAITAYIPQGVDLITRLQRRNVEVRASIADPV